MGGADDPSVGQSDQGVDVLPALPVGLDRHHDPTSRFPALLSFGYSDRDEIHIILPGCVSRTGLPGDPQARTALPQWRNSLTDREFKEHT